MILRVIRFYALLVPSPPTRNGLALLGILRAFEQMASWKVSLMVDMNELYVDLKVTTNKTFCLRSVLLTEPISFW